jgi:hypothetical protein
MTFMLNVCSCYFHTDVSSFQEIVNILHNGYAWGISHVRTSVVPTGFMIARYIALVKHSVTLKTHIKRNVLAQYGRKLLYDCMFFPLNWKLFWLSVENGKNTILYVLVHPLHRSSFLGGTKCQVLLFSLKQYKFYALSGYHAVATLSVRLSFRQSSHLLKL